MKIQDYIKARNEKRRAEILELEAKVKENETKAQALDVILGEKDEEGETNG